MTEDSRAAKVALGQAYANYMAASAEVRARLKAEFKARLDDAIDQEIGELKAKMGRALARSPLPVTEKQRITSTTNWYRYQELIAASGEVDVSSREGRMQAKLDSLKSGSDQKEDPQKTGSDQNPVVEITDWVAKWSNRGALLQLAGASESWRWFFFQPVPGGEGTFWVASDDGQEVTPVLVADAGVPFEGWTEGNTRRHVGRVDPEVAQAVRGAL